MKKVGVVLAGCGWLDGAEIQEAVATLLALMDGVASLPVVSTQKGSNPRLITSFCLFANPAFGPLCGQFAGMPCVNAGPILRAMLKLCKLFLKQKISDRIKTQSKKKINDAAMKADGVEITKITIAHDIVDSLEDDTKGAADAAKKATAEAKNFAPTEEDKKKIKT